MKERINIAELLKKCPRGMELDNLNDKNALSEYFEAQELAALAAVNYIIDNNLV